MDWKLEMKKSDLEKPLIPIAMNSPMMMRLYAISCLLYDASSP